MNGDNCKVSVICITYNQDEYLPKAIESIVSQKTSFKFEIIVRNDASTDETTLVLESLKKKYPDILYIINNEENLFSKGVDFFAETIYRYANGEYIAICEGDDYWTDEFKLQSQFDEMERNPQSDMCACRTVMVSEDGKHVLGEIRPKEKNCVLTAEDVIYGGGMYLATASLFFRKSMYDHMMEFEKIRSLDCVYQMKGALRGGICYIDRPMAAYRRYSKSSVTVQIVGDDASMRHQCEQEKEILRTLDEETGGNYHEVITKRLEDYSISYYDQLAERKDEIIKLLDKENTNIYIWGMGPRGRNLEHFLQDEKITICGVCDITDNKVGQRTANGNNICACDDVLKNADLILASVNGAYDYLKKQEPRAAVINMHEFMPRS